MSNRNGLNETKIQNVNVVQDIPFLDLKAKSRGLGMHERNRLYKIKYYQKRKMDLQEFSQHSKVEIPSSTLRLKAN